MAHERKTLKNAGLMAGCKNKRWSVLLFPKEVGCRGFPSPSVWSWIVHLKRIVQRFKGTLQRMLQIYIQAEPGNWEKWLPYLMFAYREVPRETWGLLPFKLLCGRYVRDLLNIVRESFEESEADYGHFSPSVTLH